MPLETRERTLKFAVEAASGDRSRPEAVDPAHMKKETHPMANVTLYHPFADTAMDDLFRGFFRPVRGEREAVSIKLDVAEKDGAYVVKAEIPGVSKDDIQVSIEGNQVTIGAEVKRENEKKEGERVLHSERYYGSAFRSFTLPSDLDEEASKAKYENGVLELTLAKKPAVAGRKLTIQ
jgi:HSP20 family protein